MGTSHQETKFGHSLCLHLEYEIIKKKKSVSTHGGTLLSGRKFRDSSLQLCPRSDSAIPPPANEWLERYFPLCWAARWIDFAKMKFPFLLPRDNHQDLGPWAPSAKYYSQGQNKHLH